MKTDNTTALEKFIAILIVMVVVAGLMSLPWLLWNHAVAPAFGWRHFDYFPFVGIWIFAAMIFKLIGLRK